MITGGVNCTFCFAGAFFFILGGANCTSGASFLITGGENFASCFIETAFLTSTSFLTTGGAKYTFCFAGASFFIRVIDLYGEDGAAQGTKVNIAFEIAPGAGVAHMG